MDTHPKVLKVKKGAGIAGQYSLTATVQYPDESPDETTFVGSVYGGPIVMVLSSGRQVFVSSRVTDRIGTTLDEAWIRRFFGPENVA